jgi:hypothetical protein
MKMVSRILGAAILTLATLAGCDFLPTVGPATKPAPESTQVRARSAKPHQLVMPEDVNEANRREMAKLLAKEMDLDEEEVTAPAAASEKR